MFTCSFNFVIFQVVDIEYLPGMNMYGTGAHDMENMSGKFFYPLTASGLFFSSLISPYNIFQHALILS